MRTVDQIIDEIRQRMGGRINAADEERVKPVLALQHARIVTECSGACAKIDAACAAAKRDITEKAQEVEDALVSSTVALLSKVRALREGTLS